LEISKKLKHKGPLLFQGLAYKYLLLVILQKAEGTMLARNIFSALLKRCFYSSVGDLALFYPLHNL
jgi:hypothetical protein